MICKACKKEIADGVQFCRHCGARVIDEEFDDNLSIDDEPAFIAEEPAFIAEEPVNFSAADVGANIGMTSQDFIQQDDFSDNTASQSTAIATEIIPESITTDYSSAQQPDVVKKSKHRKKLNLPAAIAVCAAFGILITAFSAVSVSIASVRKTLERSAVSEQINKLYIGDIVIGDTDLANGIVENDKLSKDATISDVVKIKLDEYEKYVIRGILDSNKVTVEDIKQIDNIDLEKFVGKIDGINSVDELNIDAFIDNFNKLDKTEINTIINKYSNEEFPELTFEIDKRRVEDLLNDKQSPAKAYLSDIVKAYEVYLLTGNDTKPVTQEKLNKLSQDSVNYVLEGMNSAYTEEINKEMAQVIVENKAAWNTLNPSSVFGIFGNILPMSLSNITIIVTMALAVVFAAVTALITKRIDAPVITFGISLMLTGTAAICMNTVPANLAQITGLNCKIVSETAAEIFKETFAGDFTVFGIISLLVGVAVVIGVILAKVITRSIKNKSAK